MSKVYVDSRNKNSLETSLKEIFNISEKHLQAYIDPDRDESVIRESWDGDIEDSVKKEVKSKIKKNIKNLTHVMIYHIGHSLDRDSGVDTLLPLDKILIEENELSHFLKEHQFTISHETEKITGVSYKGIPLTKRQLEESLLYIRLSIGEGNDSNINGYFYPIERLNGWNNYKYLDYPEVLERFDEVATKIDKGQKCNIIADYIKRAKTIVYTVLVPIEDLWIPEEETIESLLYKKYYSKLQDYHYSFLMQHIDVFACCKDGVSIHEKDIVNRTKCYFERVQGDRKMQIIE